MKNPGFSLIEIMIAMAISAVLSLILYRSFSQTSRLVQQVRDMIEETSDTLSSYAQLEKDFSAIFMPASEDIKKIAPQPATPAQNQNTPPAQPAPEPKKQEQKKTEIIPFKTVNEESKLASISFVSTNAFMVLDEAAPRPVRVTYKFKPQEGEGKKLYALLREEVPYDQKAESSEKKSSAKPAHAYALVRNISSFVAKFSAYDCQEGSKELVSLSEWGTDEQKKKCPERAIPEFVELTWDVLDSVNGRTVSYKFAVAIPAARCPKETAPDSAPAVAQGYGGHSKATSDRGKTTQPAAQQTSQQPAQGAPQNQKTNNLRIFIGGGATV